MNRFKIFLMTVLLVGLMSGPTSADLYMDDTTYSGGTGSTLIRKPSGRFGGPEQHTLIFTGFNEGNETVTQEFTLPDHLAGKVSHLSIYVSDSNIIMDGVRFRLRQRNKAPVYTEEQCKPILSGYTFDNYKNTYTDEQRRAFEECSLSHWVEGDFVLSYAKTTSEWKNNWSSGNSGGTVESSRVFSKRTVLVLLNNDIPMETPRVLEVNDTEKRISTSKLNSTWPVGTSVSELAQQDSFYLKTDIDNATYWEMKLEEDSPLSAPVSITVELYIY